MQHPTRLKLTAAKLKQSVCALALVVAGTLSSHAQQTYSPDPIYLDGANHLSFPASEAFDLKDGATIEFWVKCDWETDAGYDPVILSNMGGDGARYLIAITGDRTELSFQSGEHLQSTPFACNADEMQHVVLAEFAGSSAVMINGRVVGTFDFGFADLASQGLWIGSADGQQAPFTGAIAGLRFWDVALDRGDLVDFSVRDVFQPDAPHPELDALLVQSDFENDTLEIFAPFEADETVTGESE